MTTESQIISLLENGLLGHITPFIYPNERASLWSLNKNILTNNQNNRVIQVNYDHLLDNLKKDRMCFGNVVICEFSYEKVYCCLDPEPDSAFCGLCAHILYVKNRI